MFPSAVALVTSGSRGNRLLFYHTGVNNAEGEEFFTGFIPVASFVL